MLTSKGNAHETQRTGQVSAILERYCLEPHELADALELVYVSAIAGTGSDHWDAEQRERCYAAKCAAIALAAALEPSEPVMS